MFTNTIIYTPRKCPPFLLAFLIWLLTSLVFGLGCLLYIICFEGHADIALFIPLTIAAAVCSSPVFIAIGVALLWIADLRVSAVRKIKRLALTCATGILPYALIGGNIFADSYNNSRFWIDYGLYALATEACLFLCSLVAMLISGPIIQRFFAATETAYSKEETIFV